MSANSEKGIPVDHSGTTVWFLKLLRQAQSNEGVETVMGIMDSAKDMLGGSSEQIDGAVDAAAAQVKEHTPDQVDGAVDQGAQMAKDAIKDQLS